MNGKWRWLIYAIVVWQFVRATIAAFVVPWRWNADQCIFLLFAFAICFSAATWLFVWIRGGSAGLRQYQLVRNERWSKSLNPKLFRWSLLFWIVVAMVLVVFFNFVRT